MIASISEVDNSLAVTLVPYTLREADRVSFLERAKLDDVQRYRIALRQFRPPRSRPSNRWERGLSSIDFGNLLAILRCGSCRIVLSFQRSNGKSARIARPFGVGFVSATDRRIRNRTDGRPPGAQASDGLLLCISMGVAIAGLALTPPHSMIGIAAPILVIFFRMLQGFALGGEAGPTTAFLLEVGATEKRGSTSAFSWLAGSGYSCCRACRLRASEYHERTAVRTSDGGLRL